ncbi:MAG: hypothetical protein V4568_11730 [Pseudomonadota bacterium]
MVAKGENQMNIPGEQAFVRTFLDAYKKEKNRADSLNKLTQDEAREEFPSSKENSAQDAVVSSAKRDNRKVKVFAGSFVNTDNSLSPITPVEASIKSEELKPLKTLPQDFQGKVFDVTKTGLIVGRYGSDSRDKWEIPASEKTCALFGEMEGDKKITVQNDGKGYTAENYNIQPGHVLNRTSQSSGSSHKRK